MYVFVRLRAGMCVRACVRMYVFVCLRACMRIRAFLCVYVCVCVGGRGAGGGGGGEVSAVPTVRQCSVQVSPCPRLERTCRPRCMPA